MPPRPLAVLFDLDGTLIDSIGLLLLCVRHAFDGRSVVPTDEEWVAGIGTPLVAQLKPFASDDADLEALIGRYRAFQRAHHDAHTTAFPGVLDTVRALHAGGHPLAVVTSKADDLARRGLRYVGLEPMFDAVIGCDACSRHKPDPEPVQIALSRLGYAPSEAVFVGDSVHDIASGNAAGVITIAALWGPFSRATLSAAEPAHYMERITELPALLHRLSREHHEGLAAPPRAPMRA
jgi:pyrophosphatase PpaX